MDQPVEPSSMAAVTTASRRTRRVSIDLEAAGPQLPPLDPLPPVSAGGAVRIPLKSSTSFTSAHRAASGYYGHHVSAQDLRAIHESDSDVLQQHPLGAFRDADDLDLAAMGMDESGATLPCIPDPTMIYIPTAMGYKKVPRAEALRILSGAGDTPSLSGAAAGGGKGGHEKAGGAPWSPGSKLAPTVPAIKRMLTLVHRGLSVASHAMPPVLLGLSIMETILVGRDPTALALALYAPIARSLAVTFDSLLTVAIVFRGYQLITAASTPPLQARQIHPVSTVSPAKGSRSVLPAVPPVATTSGIALDHPTPNTAVRLESPRTARPHTDRAPVPPILPLVFYFIAILGGALTFPLVDDLGSAIAGLPNMPHGSGIADNAALAAWILRAGTAGTAIAPAAIAPGPPGDWATIVALWQIGVLVRLGAVIGAWASEIGEMARVVMRKRRLGGGGYSGKHRDPQ
ncbi:hypothetical protein BC828DRAFT_381704 [Blastocladiella britannica]|nr:hypothetical protein BC828DRAFT_381704 [Blastocladiella britannica]